MTNKHESERKAERCRLPPMELKDRVRNGQTPAALRREDSRAAWPNDTLGPEEIIFMALSHL